MVDPSHQAALAAAETTAIAMVDSYVDGAKAQFAAIGRAAAEAALHTACRATLPAGTRVDLAFYFISDAKGARAQVSVRNLLVVPANIKVVCTAMEKQPPYPADDWRLMTKEEVSAYLAEEREEADHG